MTVSVRTASFRDLGRIEEIQREGGGELSETASRGPVRLWSLVSQTLSAILPALYHETLLFVAEEEGTVIGFIQASNRPAAVGLVGATTLQVLNLCVDPAADTDDGARLLIDHLTNQALERGVLRLFVRLPLEDPLAEIFRKHSFRQYAMESVLYTEKPAGKPCPELPGLRPGARPRPRPRLPALPQAHPARDRHHRSADLQGVACPPGRVVRPSPDPGRVGRAVRRRSDRGRGLAPGAAELQHPTEHALLHGAARGPPAG